MTTLPNYIISDWTAVSTANHGGDGAGDILWRNDLTGANRLWSMDGATVSASTALPTVAPAFASTVVGDFDGDGVADLLLRNEVNGLSRMLLSGNGFSAPTGAPRVPGAFDAAAGGDVNRDGADDLFWFNTNSGALTVFAMKGSGVTGVSSFASGYTGADRLHAVFNGEALNTFDSLWFDDSTNAYNIVSHDAGVRTVSDSFTVQSGMSYVNSADYNGDGNTDFFFHNDSGSIEIVFSNGTADVARLFYSTFELPGIAAEAGGDFDGDGIAEVLLRNQVDGSTSLYNAIGGSTSGNYIVGGNGNNLIDGQGGLDKLFGRDGDDILLGGTLNDTVFGGGGDDRIDGGDDHDRIWGGTGDDEILGGSGDDLVNGGAGDDTLTSGAGTDILQGDAGDDFLIGTFSDFNHMQGGTGNDVIMNTSSSPFARSLQEGNSGNDQIFGGNSVDHLFGGIGDDYLLGGDSRDVLDGGSGNDILIGVDPDRFGFSSDSLTGGVGDDFFYLGDADRAYYTGSSFAVITDFSTSSDHVLLNGTSSSYSYVDTGSDVEIRQASDVIAVVENVANATDVSDRAIYIG